MIGYFMSQNKPINILCGQNAEFFIAEAGDKHSYRHYGKIKGGHK
jgi:hypothetical protein